MKLQAAPFESIRAGRKTVEMRLYDEKRQQIAVGDTIVFRCGEESLAVGVRKLHRFPNFEALYAAMPHAMLGSSDPKDMEQYYSQEEQLRYGVLGIEIALIER